MVLALPSVQIPVRFYGYDTIIYLVCAIIGFMIAYNALKLYHTTRSKNHQDLYRGFVILSAGLLTLALTTGYVYLKYFVYNYVSYFDTLFGVDDLGFWIYLTTSLVAYLFFVKMYSIDHGEKLLFTVILTSNYFVYFNAVLFLLIAYVAFRSISNYFMSKSQNKLLVMIAFSSMALYHGLLMFSVFSKLIYVLANLFLLGGFVALLVMLMKVNKVRK